MSGGYHEAYAITRKGEIAVINTDGHYLVFSSMQVAAQNLTVLAKANPGAEFTIRPFKMLIPWSKQGF